MADDEEWCNHDPVAVVDGICECGMRVHEPGEVFATRGENGRVRNYLVKRNGYPIQQPHWHESSPS